MVLVFIVEFLNFFDFGPVKLSLFSLKKFFGLFLESWDFVVELDLGLIEFDDVFFVDLL